ncbi:MAG: PKD domain-containing protein [Candidatus Binatia bacterium]|nr:PKD domain-containing protein [Candidatus Binatia bacterium]
MAMLVVVSSAGVPAGAFAGLCGAYASPSRGPAPLTVEFHGLASQCERNRGKEFWIVDGVPTTGVVSFTKRLETPGDYPWEFCSWLAGCEQCCDSGTVHVEPGVCRLDCEVVATPRGDELPLVVDFRATALPVGCPGAQLTYEWDFGDGQTSQAQQVTHEYGGVGPYHWQFTARYGSVSCTSAGSLQVQCIRVGGLRFCADEVRQDVPDSFWLSGNLRINDLAQFTRPVQLYTGSNPRLVALGELLVRSQSGTVWIRPKGDQVLAFDIEGAQSRLDSSPGFSTPGLVIVGLPTIGVVALRSLVFRPEEVLARIVSIVGLSGVAELARIDGTQRFAPGRCPEFVELRVLSGSVSPSISFAEIEVRYDCERQRLDTRFVCRFPFSGLPSYIGTFGFEPCGFNRFDATIGQFFGEGVTITPPVVPVRLKAGRDLVVRGDHICDGDPFAIYVGTRATLCIDVGVDCVSIPGEFFRIADLGLGYQHPFNFDIRAGTAQILGFPVAGLRGRLQGNQPPLGMFVRGYANLAQFVAGDADLSFSFSRPLVYGGIRGTLQIPQFACDPVNFVCKVTRRLLTEVAGPLPVQFANTSVVVAGRAGLDTWSATAQANLQLRGWPLVVLLQLAPEGATLQFGRNYAEMYSLDLGSSVQRAASGSGTIDIPTIAPHGVFAFFGRDASPEVQLVTPGGVVLDRSNVSRWLPGAFALEDREENALMFFLPEVAAGRWQWSSHGPAVDAVRVLGVRQQPRAEFEEVGREGNFVHVRARVQPASAAAGASLEYTGAFAGGVFGTIDAEVDVAAGRLTATWPLDELGSDTYRLRLVVRDDSHLPVVVEWPEPIVIDRGELAPPSNLRGMAENGRVLLEWDPSPGAFGYMVAFTDSAEQSAYPFVRSVPGGTKLPVGGLTPGQRFRFVVVAIDADGRASLPSNPVEVSLPAGLCTGDCDGNWEVTIDEIIRGVNIALELAPLSVCSNFDRSGDGAVTVEEIIAAVGNALLGCGPEDSTPTATATASARTATATAPPLPTLTPVPTVTATRTPSAVPFTATPTPWRTATNATRPSSTPSATPTRLRTATPTATLTPPSERFCQAPGIAIPDNDPFGIADTLTVPAGGSLGALRVDVEISHSWVGDLALWLVHVETGTQVLLLERPGEAPVGCDGNDVRCTFADAASVAAQDACTDLVPAIGGTVRPMEPLATFGGEDPVGTWLLGVADHAPGDTGTLVRWCLAFGS